MVWPGYGGVELAMNRNIFYHGPWVQHCQHCCIAGDGSRLAALYSLIGTAGRLGQQWIAWCSILICHSLSLPTEMYSNDVYVIDYM
jgi:hypothetical protein